MSPMFKPTGEDYYAYASSAHINGVGMTVRASKRGNEVSVSRAGDATYITLNFPADMARALAAELIVAADAIGFMGGGHE